MATSAPEERYPVLALAGQRIYLDGTDLERDCEALLKFRLTYEGPLLSSNPFDPDKRIEHKHNIRRAFHPQLKRLWETDRFLSAWTLPDDGSTQRLINLSAQQGSPARTLQTMQPAAAVLSRTYGHNGYGFVPLVRDGLFLACSLRILCLRRDGPGALSATRDIDNRIKTLIDALTYVPAHKWKPLGGSAAGQDEDPLFYVLLEDDRNVTHLEVETDNALAPNPADPSDETFVRLVISVEIRPYLVTMNNLSFS